MVSGDYFADFLLLPRLFFPYVGRIISNECEVEMDKAKRQPTLKLPARAGIWNIISALVARGVGVVGTPIFTRLLTPTEYGLYPLYVTWLGVFTSVITLGLTSGAILRGLQRYEGRRVEFLSAAMGLFLTVFGVGAVLILTFSEGISRLTGLSTYLYGMILSEILLSGIIAFMLARQKYEYRYRASALINILSAIGTPVVSVLLVRYTPYHAEARIIGSLLVSAAIAIPLFYKMMRGHAKLYDGGIWRYLLSVSLPLMPHLLSSSLILRASEMVIARTHGSAALGKYSVAMSLGLALTVLTNGLGQVFAPWVLRKIREGRVELAREYVMLAVRGLVLTALLVLSVAPELLAILTPPAYHDSLPAVYPLMLSTVAMFVSNVSMSGGMYYERNARASLPTVLVAIISSLVAALLLPRLDYRWAGVFTLLGYTLLALLNSATFRRLSGERIADGGVCLGALSLGALYAALLYLLRDVLIIRLLLAVAILPLLFNTGRRVWRGVKE